MRISGQQGYQVSGRTAGWLQQGGYPGHQQHSSSQLAGALPPTSAPHMPGRPGKLANVLKNSQLQITDLPGAKRPVNSGRRSAGSSQSRLVEEGVRHLILHYFGRVPTRNGDHLCALLKVTTVSI